MNKKNQYLQITALLNELHNSYPSYNMGKHLSTALDGYGDAWGITDRELLFALTKYKAELDMDIPHTNEGKEIDDIIKQGMDLDSILKEEEEDY